jgi:putative membrane protein insertion efficiency factor
MKAILSLLNKSLCAPVILVVYGYKMLISPLIGPCCRFEPTCSTYCIDALRTHGLFRGLWLTVCRLFRCRPFGPSGFDPVPEKHINLKKESET